jgi:hypothetical protein
MWNYSVPAADRVDIYLHEYEAGEWHRDVEPCYPDDSRSEISFEGILGALHALHAEQDSAGFERLADYGWDNGYKMGDGPDEYTKMPQLALILPLVRQGYKLASIEDMLTGYRGNVLAYYLHLKGVTTGSLNVLEVEFLEEMTELVPSNPIYHALYHKYTDGDQTVAISILSDTEVFPVDRLPEESLKLFDWSDGPAAILYLYTLAILEEGTQ